MTLLAREQLLDDLTRPGIDVLADSRPPVPDRRSWLSRCATAVQAGDIREVDALAALLDDGSEVADAFRVEKYWPGGRGAPEDGSGGPRVSAARAIIDVAYAICDPAQESVRLASAAARWRRAGVLTSGPSGPPAGALPGTLTKDPAIGYARLMSQALSGTLAQPAHPVHVAVVFGRPAGGSHGKLTLAVQPAGPRGLYPDPRSMTFVAADDKFAESLDIAWRGAPEDLMDQCVVWDVSDRGRPFRDRIDGDSLGAAFGVGLHELSRATRPTAKARVRRLDPRCAVTGRLDGDGGCFQSATTSRSSARPAASGGGS